MKQVLIINITRMGDLVQTVPLIRRLQHEWPGVAIDLVVDTRFAPVAVLLPGLRTVIAYDFQRLIDESRSMAKDVVALYQDLASWAKPLVDVRYDRVVNLTFNRRSGLLAGYVNAPDIRGVANAPDGTTIVRNPWMGYFTDLHHHRRFNCFNLVDLYALGGSGPGPFSPLTVSVPTDAAEWARALLARVTPLVWIAVQVGASEPIKAWRPEYFGQTMAAISRQIEAGFVLIGTSKEKEAVQQACAVYRAAGGTGPLCDQVNRTNLSQLVGLLDHCQLLLTNDTGPMHLAVGVGTPVIDLSVGHVDFRETGPYGPGHWVVQPDLACAPCGFDQVCLHHACKDRLVAEQVAALCLHVLRAGPFPTHMTGVRLYESSIDADGLACYQLRAGQTDAIAEWYGSFWRTFWYEAMTGQSSLLAGPEGPSPDRADVSRLAEPLRPLLSRLTAQSNQLVRLSRQQPCPVAELQAAQARLREERQRAIALAVQSPAFGPLAVAFLRDSHNGDAQGLANLAQQQATAFHAWRNRTNEVLRRLGTFGTTSKHESRRVGILGASPAVVSSHRDLTVNS